MQRPLYQWDLGRRSLALGERTLVMGVLNVTPDSFSDGGRFYTPEAAVAHGLSLLDEGADILDIGGESTRPGTPTAITTGPALAGAVSAEEEIDRVLPVIEALKRERPNAILSIDTYKAKVARYAIEAGVEIVNDVSGFLWDPAMARTISERPCGSILMHTRGLPHEWRSLPPVEDIVALVREDLRGRISDTLDQGIARRTLVLDPGFGFGKNFDENYPLLARLSEFHVLGFPILAAASRKSFLGHTVAARLAQLAVEATGEPSSPSLLFSTSDELPADGTRTASLQPAPSNHSHTARPGANSVPPIGRDTATLAASVAAALAGAHIVRTHSVRPSVEALAVADAILRASAPIPLPEN